MNDELENLLAALCNDTITESEHSRLSELLESNPRARQTYFEYLEIDQRLALLASADQDAAPTEQQQEFDSKTANPRSARMGRLGQRSQLWNKNRLWLAVAATTAVVLISAILIHNAGNRPKGNDTIVSTNASTSIASLVQSSDCVWHPTSRPHPNELPASGKIHIEQGTAEILLQSGVLLVIHGPSRLTIHSRDSATLHSGEVVLSGSDAPEEFAMHVPNAKLFDEGTEYGVSVDPKSGAAEVHVFEGRVRIEAAGDPDDVANTNSPHGEVVLAGSGNVIDSTSTRSLPLDEDRFVRRIPPSLLPHTAGSTELIAQEDFDYTRTTLSSGGTGWAGPWRLDVLRFEPPNGTVIPNESLPYGQQSENIGGHLSQDGKGTTLRPLSIPVRMDIDAEYFVSFLLRKSRESARGVVQYGSVSLRPSSREKFVSNKLLFGVTSENSILLGHNGKQTMGRPDIQIGETYHFVAKIVAKESGTDQMMLRVFGPHEATEASEPLTWTRESIPQADSSVYTNLFIYVGGDAAFQIDRIRIGSTWQAVTTSR